MIRACIFDLDDTLVSGATVWRRAEEALFTRLGATFDPILAQSYRGLNAFGVGSVIYDALGPTDISAESCGTFLRDRLIGFSRTESVELPGATETIRLSSGLCPTAIASGSPREVIETVIGKFAWTQCVSEYVSSEEVPSGKPEPDVFLETARRLSCIPDECLVIEDSVHGAVAAKRAGMTCFVVPSADFHGEIETHSDGVFASLAEIRIAIERVFLS
jgi:beta-phosphoglucomutase-like phosphatase (HAD superfamily)